MMMQWLGRIVAIVYIGGLLGASPVAAQDLVITVKAGHGFAYQVLTASGSPFNGFSSRAGWMGGVAVRLPVTSSVSVQAEALYVEKGRRSKTEAVYQFNLGYVEVPVLVVLDVVEGGVGGLVAVVGVAPSWEVSCGGWQTGGTIGFEPSPIVPFWCEGDRSELYDLGAVFGIGGRVRLGPLRLEPELRYTRGRQDLFRPENRQFTVRNRTLHFLLGLGL